MDSETIFIINNVYGAFLIELIASIFAQAVLGKPKHLLWSFVFVLATSVLSMLVFSLFNSNYASSFIIYAAMFLYYMFCFTERKRSYRIFLCMLYIVIMSIYSTIQYVVVERFHIEAMGNWYSLKYIPAFTISMSIFGLLCYVISFFIRAKKYKRYQSVDNFNYCTIFSLFISFNSHHKLFFGIER